MDRPWSEGMIGLLRLPSGRLVLGRALASPPTGSVAEFGLYLAATRPRSRPWPSAWLRWPDFGLPLDRAAAYAAFEGIWLRASNERVEIGCRGGRGRTGTALACLAVLDGLGPNEAIDYVRQRYHRRAVETPWQRRWIERFATRPTGGDAPRP